MERNVGVARIFQHIRGIFLHLSSRIDSLFSRIEENLLNFKDFQKYLKAFSIFRSNYLFQTLSFISLISPNFYSHFFFFIQLTTFLYVYWILLLVIIIINLFSIRFSAFLLFSSIFASSLLILRFYSRNFCFLFNLKF